MRTALPRRRALAGLATALLLAPGTVASAADRVVVAWDGPVAGAGFVAALDAAPPFAFATPALELGDDARVRTAFDRIFHLSRSSGVLTVIDPATWSPVDDFALGAGSTPRDVAISDPHTVYVSRSSASSVLRLDVPSGATTEAVDLSPLGVDGVNLSMETMLLHEGRLYVQLAAPVGFPLTSFVAVVDVASGRIVDADPAQPGPQAIALEGTSPRFKMQVVPGANQLLVSATGAFQDDGGFELLDLDALASLGVVVREFVDVGGNDLGALAMIDDDRGWLVFSTDIVLSSHLHPFTISAGGQTLEAATALFYFAPHIVYDPAGDTVFFPQPGGVRAFDGTTGAERTAGPTALDGTPTDLALLPGPAPLPILPPWAPVAFGTAAVAAAWRLRARASPRSPRGPGS